MKPKVCHVATIDMSLRHLLLNQMLSIAGDGYEVVGASAPGPHVEAVEARGVRHIEVPLSRSMFTPLQDLRALWRMYRIFRRERFDIVHTHTPKPGLLGQVAARMAGVPVVVNTVHGFYFHEGTNHWMRRLFIAAEKVAARCSDAVLMQSGEDLETAVREGICGKNKLAYLGNGIDIERFDRRCLGEDRLLELRSKLGIPDHCRVVGFVGRLVAEKGFVDLLAAMATVRRAVPDVRLLIVGETDPHKPDAVSPAVAARHGIDDICVFAGWRQEMPEMYALMDVLALPSYREGFPRAPMEASAMGIPSVVTDIRGCREAVEDGVNGLLVPTGDPDALAAALVKTLTDHELAATMGAAARSLARARFDEREVFARVKSQYRRLTRAERDTTIERREALRP
ncbi:MAG: glycosyltransferase family 4 protein [Acidobacteriota bacterium]|jgi:glycosyltransferase involved in cell wall biosynthesis